MATYTFDGSQSLTTEFNAAVDRVILDVTLDDVVSFDENNNTVTLVASSGAVLTLTSTNFAALSNDNFLADFNLFFGTSGPDAPTAFAAGTLAVGLGGVDDLNGSDNADLFFGNAGDDELVGGGGADRLYGGMGNDTITQVSDSAGSLLVGGLGSDVIAVNGAFALNVFTPTAGTDGLAGDITIYGGNGTDDTADGADRIGVDLEAGGSATIYANAGADVVSVTGAGDATVYGGLGNDTIAATVNTGFVSGGAGADVITVTTTGTDASVTVYGGNGLNDSADGADNITVVLTADHTAMVYGNGGDDALRFTGNVDAEVHAFGGQGNDFIGGTALTAGYVGNGSEIYGGLGNDVVNLNVVGTNAAVTVFGGNGSTDAADGDDTITLTLAANSATSTQTALVYGNAGDDTINLVGAGTATVFGGQGDDTINVGTSAGDGTGVYQLTGGQGSDTFNFTDDGQVVSSSTTAATVNHITDLNLNEDKIDFGAPVAVAFTATTAATGANLEAAAINAFNSVTGTSAAGQQAVVLFTYQGEQYLVNAETTAPASGAGNLQTGDIEHLIRVTGVTGTLDTSDFVA